MNTVLQQMIQAYPKTDLEKPENVIKEVIQEIILCGLAQSDFFKKVAFNGGTCLRIFYGLQRFSEDLDFSLLKRDETFDLKKYFSVLQREAESLGLHIDFQQEEKHQITTVQTAIAKGNTRTQILTFYADEKLAGKFAANNLIKVKFEVDTDILDFAKTEVKTRILPRFNEVRTFDITTLFAGKLHAVISRNWRNRVKGRDLYDYVFYLQNKAKVNMDYLREKLLHSDTISAHDNFNFAMLMDMLNDRFATLDYTTAKEDVRRFIKDDRDLSYWSPSFFQTITKEFLKE